MRIVKQDVKQARIVQQNHCIQGVAEEWFVCALKRQVGSGRRCEDLER
jgi:hypothetical protein